jgi:hypothetical protein
MKKLIFILLISFSFFAKAQNWKTVSNIDTNYFTVQSPIDTQWNNYLRVIWVDSSKQISSDSVFYFYPSVRRYNDTNNCIDTLGPTWLGKILIRNSQGDEVFFNRDYDSIHIHTLASLNTSWTMCKRNGRNYIATITNLDTITIDNVLDSIKTLTITVESNGNIITDYYNNKKITFSKINGFIDALEFYCFPFKQDGYIDNDYRNVFPLISLKHSKVPKHLVKSMNGGENLQWKYQPGNDFVYDNFSRGFTHSYQNNYYHDSIANSLILGDTAIVEIKRSYLRNNYNTSQPGTPVVFSTILNTTFIDTIVNNKFTYLPEYKNQEINSNLYKNDYLKHNFFLTTFCGNKAILSRQDNYYTNCGIKDLNSSCYYGQFGFCEFYIGRTNYYIELNLTTGGSINMSTNIFSNYYHILYHNLQPCPIGIKNEALPLLNKDFNKTEIDITVYPNPNNGVFKIENNANVIINEIVLYDLQGRKMNFNKKNKNEINIQTLCTGVYMLNIYTNKGLVIKKVVKN